MPALEELNISDPAELAFNDAAGQTPEKKTEAKEEAKTPDLRAEFAQLRRDGAALIAKAKAEGGRALTDEERATADRSYTRMREIEELLQLELQFAQAAVEKPAEKKEGARLVLPAEVPGRAAFEGKSDIVVGETKIDPRAFNAALCGWATGGEMDPKFATIVTSSQSSIFLPREVATPLVPTAVNTFRDALAAVGVAPVTTATTADMNQPVITASAGGAVAQNASSETTNDPGLTGSFNLNVATYQSGTAWFSRQLLGANGYDLVPFIQNDMSYAKDLGLESAIAAALIADTNITQSVTTASASAITYAELASLNRKLPKRYDRLKVIILSADAFSAAERLVGSDGHPILVPDPQNQTLLRFNSTPVLRCDYLEALTTSKTIGVLISCFAFRIRDAGQPYIERYEATPGKPGQLGLNLLGFHGWGYDPAAIAKLKTPAS